MQLELDTALADVIDCAFPMSKIYANACRHSQVVYGSVCVCVCSYISCEWMVQLILINLIVN